MEKSLKVHFVERIQRIQPVTSMLNTKGALLEALFYPSVNPQAKIIVLNLLLLPWDHPHL